MADDVSVEIIARIENLLAGMEHAKESILGLADPLSSVASVAKEVGEAIVAAFAVEKLAEFTESMVALGRETQRTSALLGIATTEVAALRIAGAVTGTSLETITMSLERLGMALARSDAGSAQARAGFAALGISAADFQKLAPEKQLGTLADAFSHLQDGINKDAIAMAILGRGGAAMIPLFNQGSHALEEFSEIADRAGSKMSVEMAAGLHATELGMVELSQSTQGFGNALWGIVKPAVDGTVKVLIDLVQMMTKSVNEGGLLSVAFTTLAGAAQGVVISIAIISGTLQTLWEVAKVIVFAIGESFMTLGNLIYDVFTFNFDAAGQEFAKLGGALEARAKITATNMKEIVDNMLAEIRAALSGAASEHVKIEQNKNAKLAMVNKDALSAAMKDIDAKIVAEQEGLKRTVMTLNAEANANRMTQDAKFAAVASYTEKSYAAELALLNQKLAIIPAGELKMRAGVNLEIEKLQQKHTTEMLKIDQQAAASMQKNWEGALGSITGAFNNQLRGLLTGTTTFAQAAKGILLDLTTKAIEFVEQWVVKWAAGQLANLTATKAAAAVDVATSSAAEAAKTTATVVGVTGRVAAEETGSAAIIATKLSEAFTFIAASLAEAFAGIVAAFSFLGPGAPIAAAAVVAGVGAVAYGMIHGFDEGTDYVQRSGLAMIHQGETIVPAEGSGPYTGAGGKGGAGVTVQLMAWDGASVQNWLKRGGAEMMAKHISDVMTLNPSLRPSF